MTEEHKIHYSTEIEGLKKEVSLHTFRASGPGGQHRNVTDSGVRLIHHASGVIVTATESRSQIRNKEKAFERLVARLEKLNHVQKKRRPTRKSKAARRRELEGKQHTQKKKRLREKPRFDD